MDISSAFDEFDAADDNSAVERACKHGGANPLELWCEHRKVGRSEADDPAARIVARWHERKAAIASIADAAE